MPITHEDARVASGPNPSPCQMSAGERDLVYLQEQLARVPRVSTRRDGTQLDVVLMRLFGPCVLRLTAEDPNVAHLLELVERVPAGRSQRRVLHYAIRRLAETGSVVQGRGDRVDG
ncbi:hypothetical protein AB3K78_01325 [Leucobacter sp. HNU]|uniref:hypothetical protein n=1 Tax=Leucobacter sp. HNU TaxID=3236805 RepID=UPI003A80A0B6